MKIRGTVDGPLLFGAVGMQDCEYTVISGDPAIPLTVARLIKDIAADEDAAMKKYDGKVVLLSGEFVSNKRDVHQIVELKGDGKGPIYCKAWSSDDPFLKQLKVGETITFMGELKVTNAGKLKILKDKVELENAILTRAAMLPP